VEGDLAGVGFAECGEHLDITGSCHRRDFTHQAALTDARWPHHTDHRAVAVDCAVQQALNGGHFPVPSNQIRLCPPGSAVPVAHAQQPKSGDWFVGPLDQNVLRLIESGSASDQPRGGRAEHHPTRRGHRFHPLRHANLLTHGGVTERPRADFTGDHLPGVQPDPQPQIHTVSLADIDGKPLRLLLNAQGRQTGPNGVVFQRDRRAEHRHDPVARPLCDRAAVPLHYHRTAVGEVGHDLAQPLGTQRRRDVHRVHHVGEQDGHLLVLRRGSGWCDWRAASVAEP
jgi:hypothetical protein